MHLRFLAFLKENSKNKPSKDNKEVKNIQPQLILIPQSEYKIFTVGSDEPYVKYITAGLISCSAFILRYQHENKQKVVLYHALSGIPTELPEITQQIQKDDNVKPENITISIRSSDESKAAEPLLVAEKRILYLKKAGFPDDHPFDIEYGYSSCSIDTHGKYGPDVRSIPYEASEKYKKR